MCAYVYIYIIYICVCVCMCVFVCVYMYILTIHNDCFLYFCGAEQVGLEKSLK